MDPSKASFESTTTAAGTEQAGFYEVQDKEWRTFLCIPSRYAMLVLVALLTLMSMTSLFMGSVLYSKLEAHVTDFQRVAIILHIFVYAVLVFFCGFGLYAVIYRCRTRGSAFCAMLIGQILFEIAIGGICLFFLFNGPDRKEDVTPQFRHCLESIANSPNDLFIKDLCYRAPVAQGVCLALFLFMWILQLFTWYASNRYVSQLQEEYVTEQARGKDVEDSGEALWH